MLTYSLEVWAQRTLDLIASLKVSNGTCTICGKNLVHGGMPSTTVSAQSSTNTRNTLLFCLDYHMDDHALNYRSTKVVFFDSRGIAMHFKRVG